MSDVEEKKDQGFREVKNHNIMVRIQVEKQHMADVLFGRWHEIKNQQSPYLRNIITRYDPCEKIYDLDCLHLEN